MRTHTTVIERDPDTHVFVGYLPGFPGAHSQGERLDELHTNLRKVMAMLLEDGEPPRNSPRAFFSHTALAHDDAPPRDS